MKREKEEKTTRALIVTGSIIAALSLVLIIVFVVFGVAYWRSVYHPSASVMEKLKTPKLKTSGARSSAQFLLE
jgi:hypothetical protein